MIAGCWKGTKGPLLKDGIEKFNGYVDLWLVFLYISGYYNFATVRPWQHCWLNSLAHMLEVWNSWEGVEEKKEKIIVFYRIFNFSCLKDK